MEMTDKRQDLTLMLEFETIIPLTSEQIECKGQILL